MECDPLTSQPVESILDSAAGYPEVTSVGPETFGGCVAA